MTQGAQDVCPRREETDASPCLRSSGQPTAPPRTPEWPPDPRTSLSVAVCWGLLLSKTLVPCAGLVARKRGPQLPSQNPRVSEKRDLNDLWERVVDLRRGEADLAPGMLSSRPEMRDLVCSPQLKPSACETSRGHGGGGAGCTLYFASKTCIRHVAHKKEFLIIDEVMVQRLLWFVIERDQQMRAAAAAAAAAEYSRRKGCSVELDLMYVLHEPHWSTVCAVCAHVCRYRRVGQDVCWGARNVES